MVGDPRRFDWAFSQILGLAKAIKELHDKKTRHGDIKPANILVDQEILMIADAGLAKFHALYTRERRGPTTTFHGSRMYEPPEAVISGAKLSRRYDVWSFGCVLFEFILWLVKGPQGYCRFIEEVRNGQEIEQAYWEKTNDIVIIRPAVRRWINDVSAAIEEVDSQYSPALKRLLALVEDRLLIVKLDERGPDRPRADSDELVGKLKKILGNQDSTALFDVFDSALHELAMSNTSTIPKEEMNKILPNIVSNLPHN